ncbi:MAG TPA: hypothetical protein VFY73_20270 [Ideonella sp.]|uniref:hypothetical protein n=1 Tax=Ideonella sp. TaxID=1929293 RepID=UPI002E37DC36|nr:hypothetical protein [Ideonella sp.]HEX5686370.1 hypothetical protein [Ideonella sp.]
MNVLQLIDEARRQVPDGAPLGTRWHATSEVNTGHGRHTVEVSARIDAQGRRREQFWCDGTRVEQHVLLRLTCAEVECPHAVAVRAQWQAHHQQGPAKAPAARPPQRSLIQEIPVNVGGHQLVARPARFPCLTPCPHKAHPPLTIDKTGFDLFEDGHCLAGGVMEFGGVRQPRLPSVGAAEAFVLARQIETLVALGEAIQSSRPKRGRKRKAS